MYSVITYARVCIVCPSLPPQTAACCIAIALKFTCKPIIWGLVKTQIASPVPRVSDSTGFGEHPIFCMSNEFPGDGDNSCCGSRDHPLRTSAAYSVLDFISHLRWYSEDHSSDVKRTLFLLVAAQYSTGRGCRSLRH